MSAFAHIESLLSQCRADEALAALAPLTASADTATAAQAYYLTGRAYGKLGDWRHAINAYCEAMERDPDGPAREAYNRANQILDFYCHDLYNP